jgi:hypothetical protein
LNASVETSHSKKTQNCLKTGGFDTPSFHSGYSTTEAKMKPDKKLVEQLVEIITHEVLAAMAEEEARSSTPEGYQ